MTLVVVLMLLNGCSSLTFLAANTPATFGDYTRLDNLTYADQARNKLDVYVPKSPHTKSHVIIFVHGGGWYEGDKANYKFVGAF
ncbi:MAG: alpha/beta hydrolase, partial [Steroidobacter sp.]